MTTLQFRFLLKHIGNCFLEIHKSSFCFLEYGNSLAKKKTNLFKFWLIRMKVSYMPNTFVCVTMRMPDVK